MSHWVSQLLSSIWGQVGLLRFLGFTRVRNVKVEPYLCHSRHPRCDRNFIVLYFLLSIYYHTQKAEFIKISVSAFSCIAQSCDLWGHPHLVRLEPQLNPRLWISNGTWRDSPYESVSCDAIRPTVREVLAFVMARGVRGFWITNLIKMFPHVSSCSIFFRITFVKFQWHNFVELKNFCL